MKDYVVPTLPGYQPTQTKIDATTVSGDSVDQSINVYYTPIEQTITIQYVDESGQNVDTQEVKGYTGDTVY
ncbi:hypothetical protein MOO45_06555 [Bombilactobacillus folatiphilus]|uniref:Mub B2-like domain-containing protein n=1 Tax=Bombilactobacillus folatiphilus TaxID=2923362 RepID=A0ABY4P8D0_9LACO|nr:hypothetical protein [Bombilactobacillus folatiphilus]UQS81850.1 hypothetical protein MOO45_06555 [Bombilactobacillus folatiphilus]